jgi:large subunit ribosomal protein L4
MKVDVINWQKSKVAEMDLCPDIFAAPLRSDIVSRVVNWQLAKRRAGTHKSKEIGDISGSTKKIYRQKGTGGARHGSKRGPQFRGGAVIFGPVVRSHEYSLQKKVRKLGLKIALSSKLASNKLYVLENFDTESVKTKDFSNLIQGFDVQSALFIDTNDVNENFLKASSNIHSVDYLCDVGANVYDIIRKDALFITKRAVSALEARLA